MSYVALDLGSRTGWAQWWPGLPAPYSGVQPLARFDKGNVGPDLEKLRAFLAELHKIHPVQILFYEAPIKLPTDTLPWLRFIYGVAGIVDWWAHRLGIECREVAINDWRDHFIGYHNGGREALKLAAVDACNARAWQPKDDNAAEALGVLDYGLACWKIDVPWRDATLMRGAA